MNQDRLCHQIQADPHAAGRDAALRAHAASCAACGAYVAGVTALGERLRGLRSFAGPMPSVMRSGMLAQLAACAAPAPAAASRRPAKPAQRGFAQRAFMPVALAASLAVGVLIGRDVIPPRPAANLGVVRTIGNYIDDVTHDHFLIEGLGRPLEIAVADRGELSAWLSTSLGFGVELPPTGRDFDLQGGRVWHTVGRLSSLASYTLVDGTQAILFAVPTADLELAGAPSSRIGGIRVYNGAAWGREARVWIEGDLAMALVALDGHLPETWAETFLP